MTRIPVKNSPNGVAVDESDLRVLEDFRWYVGNNGYAVAAVNTGSRETQTKISMHRLVTGAAPGQTVDHINGDTLDNRRANLRFVDGTQNQANRRKNRNATSRYKGVSRHTYRSGRMVWRAAIGTGVKSRPKHLGCFQDEVSAAQAYNKAALLYFGENYALLNNV